MISSKESNNLNRFSIIASVKSEMFWCVDKIESQTRQKGKTSVRKNKTINFRWYSFTHNNHFFSPTQKVSTL